MLAHNGLVFMLPTYLYMIKFNNKGKLLSICFAAQQFK